VVQKGRELECFFVEVGDDALGEIFFGCAVDFVNEVKVAVDFGDGRFASFSI